jgi:hypothetical protein
VGGTSYTDFITDMRLPAQLAEVDPIVASFCGGAVGVVSGLLVVEVRRGAGWRCRWRWCCWWARSGAAAPLSASAAPWRVGG